MVKKALLFLFLFIAAGYVYGQQDTVGRIRFSDRDSSHIQISLLTCGPGDEEVYEVFGHTALRIIDSVKNTDIVYNYGIFEYGPNFEIQFMRGKLLYCVAAEPMDGFLQEYIRAKRKVEEQVLLLDRKQKDQIRSFLEWNALPENKDYKYDFFFDNCATRIRDIFPGSMVFGHDFKYAEVRKPGENLTFRDIVNRYFYRDHWTRLGVNILLGSKIDKVMTNADIMFLPDYLRDGIGGATVNGRTIAASPVVLLPGKGGEQAGFNGGLWTTISILLLTALGLFYKPLRVLGKVMSSLLLLITGLLGCLILVMWFATDHQGCSNNYNLLWALPLNLLLAFYYPKGTPRYALVAIVLIIVALLLHVCKVQGLIVEFIPLLLALLLVYYKLSKEPIVRPAKSKKRNALATTTADIPAAPNMYYRKMGTGPALILLHGFPENGTLWRNVWDRLSASYTLIIPDFPGSGQSVLEGEASISDMAEGVAAIMNKEGIQKAVVAGHSMGGYVAIELARLYPDRITGLSVVHSIPAADDEDKKKMRAKAIELIQNGGKTAFLSQMIPNLFAPGFKLENPAAVKEQLDEAMKVDEAGLINFYKAMMGRRDNSDIIKNATFPVQWITGKEDNVIVLKKILAYTWHSGINFVSIYEDCGHMSMVEAPERLIDDLDKFGNYCYGQHHE